MRRRRVYILSSSFTTSLTRVLQGIVDYAGPRDRWEIHTSVEPNLNRQALERADGILLGLHAPALAELLSQMGTPVVSVIEPARVAGSAAVVPDDRRIGQLAAEHLLGKGIANLGYWGPACPWGDLREAGFREVLQRRGIKCLAFGDLSVRPRPVTWSAIIRKKTIANWLRKLMTPAGILAANDGLAMSVLQIARSLGMNVPDDLAVMGVDNEPTICEPTPIPLTSVDGDLSGIGFKAAELLDGMMSAPAPSRAGDPAKVPPHSASVAIVLVPPRGVVQRRSTDALAIEDPDVRAALTFVREHARENITVEDVMARVSVCRSVLERRFVRALGQTLGREIRRVKLHSAAQMLRETPMKLDSICSYCGYKTRSHFSAAFKKEFGITASKYRQGRAS